MNRRWLLTSAILTSLIGTSLLLAQTPRPLTDKELFKRAQTENTAGKIDEAYLSVKEARAKKNKPDKNYDELFSRLGKQIADREAEKGEAACGNSDFVLCEKQLTIAKTYSETPNVSKLQATLDRQLNELRNKYKSSLQLASSDPDRGLIELDGFKKFSASLPDLTSQTEKMRLQAVNVHLAAASANIAARLWDAATVEFNRVLELAPGDVRAVTGLKETARLKDSFKLQSDAQAALDKKNYKVALQLIELAMKSAPEVDDFKAKRQTIVDAWIVALVDPMEGYLEKPDDLEKAKEAYLNLEQIRTLNSNHPKLKELTRVVNDNFGAALLLRASELEKISDFSKIGTASVSKAKAKELLSGGSVKTEELKEVFDYFNKRRTSQLLISSEDLSGTDPVFEKTAALRAKSASENASLPDLRVRNLLEYEKQPEEDPIVKGLLLDGKSSTVLLTVAVNRHDNLKKQGTVRAVKSQFNAGREQVPNPLHKETSDQVVAINKALADQSRKKEWPQLELERQLKQTQLNGMSPNREVTQIVAYEYREVSWEQDIVVEVTLTLRDYITRQVIYTPPAILVSRHITDVEVTGVHKDDSQGLQNRPPAKISDDAMKEIEKQVLDSVTKLTTEILPKYTRRFYEEAERRKTVDVDAAVENYVAHWAFFRGKLDKKEQEDITDFIQKQTGYNLVTDGDKLFRLGLVTTAAIR